MGTNFVFRILILLSNPLRKKGNPKILLKSVDKKERKIFLIMRCFFEIIITHRVQMNSNTSSIRERLFTLSILFNHHVFFSLAQLLGFSISSSLLHISKKQIVFTPKNKKPEKYLMILMRVVE